MADITREEIERIRDVANTSSNPAIHVADIISICDLALSALAPAAEPTREPDAWLYTCGKPGLRSTWASIDANDASHWPIDQWTNGYEKRPLYLASPIQPLGVLHQTPDGRVFKSFPSTDAAQTPNVAPPVHAQVVRDVLEGVIKVCEAAALQIGDEYYGTSSKGCANAFRALLRWHESQTAPVPPRAEEPVCNRCGLMGEDIPMCDKVDCDQRDVLYKGSKVHPQAPSEAVAWVPVSERLPKSGAFVLAFAVRALVTRRIRAMYVAKGTVEANEESINDECAEYDEAKDEYWLREGWYECNEYEETHWRVDDPVTHWMPLPAAPSAGTPEEQHNAD